MTKSDLLFYITAYTLAIGMVIFIIIYPSILDKHDKNKK